MILKKGDKGPQVKLLQSFLKLKEDGDFGPNTEKAVKKFQFENYLTTDGIVGPKTWDMMGLASTDLSERNIQNNNLDYIEYYLPKDEYKKGPTKKEYVFLHHTAGWHNPYKVIDSWGRDRRGSIATEFVLGGQSVKGDNSDYDGLLLQSFPEGGYGWHLGKNGNQRMHTDSVGIELCNFGYIDDGKTSSGTRVHPSQIVKLSTPFRGKSEWHLYSDVQLNKLQQWILWL